MPIPARSRAQIMTALDRLGMTPLEAEVYAFLCSFGHATGYRVAQAIGKSIGNVYKAIEGLESKGAVLASEEDSNRVVRAVPIDELVSRAAVEFSEACERATRLLRPEVSVIGDDHVYRIAHRGQFMARACGLIEGARNFVLGTVTPRLAPEITSDLSNAIERGARVGIKVFESLELKGAEVVVDPRGSAALELAPGEWMALTADGREVLLGLFDLSSGELVMGQWSENPLLAWAMFSGMSSDLVLAAIRSDPVGTDARIQQIFGRCAPFETPMSVGKSRLTERYRQPSRGARRLSGGDNIGS